jgi:hypothetical protein
MLNCEEAGHIAKHTHAAALAAGTLILTPDGPVFIEDLCVGDLVLTRDSGPQPVGQIKVSHPKHIVCVQPGSLGHGMPWRALVTDAQAGPSVARTSDDAASAAKETPAASAKIRFFQLRFSSAQMIWAEGMPVACRATTRPRVALAIPQPKTPNKSRTRQMAIA